MKLGIIATMLGALAIIVFAAPDAHGWWSSGPDVDMRFAGSSSVMDVDPDTNETSTIQNLTARGRPGFAHVTTNVVYEELGPYDGCPLVGADATATWVATYRDHSILTGSGSGYVCYDGAVFTGYVEGEITGTVGRFEGVTGTFEADASVLNSAFTGTLTGDFD